MEVNSLTMSTLVNCGNVSKAEDSITTSNGDFQTAMNKVIKSQKPNEVKEETGAEKIVQPQNNTAANIKGAKDTDVKDDKVLTDDIASLISALLNGSISIEDLKQMTLPETANKIVNDLNSVKLTPESMNLFQLAADAKSNETFGDIAKLLTGNIKDNSVKIEGFLKLAESQNIIAAADIPKMVEAVKSNLTNKASDIVNAIAKDITSNTVQMTDKNIEASDILTAVKKAISEVYKDPQTSNTERQTQVVNNDKAAFAQNLINGKDEKISTDLANSKQDSSKKNLASSDSKDESFLKDLVSTKNDDSKISRVTSYVTQFKTIANETNPLNTEIAQINKENVVADMIKTVKYMENNDIKNMTVKLVPKELGEITIKLVMENGALKANIVATNKEAYNLLNSNLQDLNSKLQGSDIKIQNFTINIYNEDTTFFKQGSNENSSGNNNSKNNKKAETIDAASEANDDTSISSALESSILKFA